MRKGFTLTFQSGDRGEGDSWCFPPPLPQALQGCLRHMRLQQEMELSIPIPGGCYEDHWLS